MKQCFCNSKVTWVCMFVSNNIFFFICALSHQWRRNVYMWGFKWWVCANFYFYHIFQNIYLWCVFDRKRLAIELAFIWVCALSHDFRPSFNFNSFMQSEFLQENWELDHMKTLLATLKVMLFLNVVCITNEEMVQFLVSLIYHHLSNWVLTI
jgi:hypothetical protein